MKLEKPTVGTVTDLQLVVIRNTNRVRELLTTTAYTSRHASVNLSWDKNKFKKNRKDESLRHQMLLLPARRKKLETSALKFRWLDLGRYRLRLNYGMFIQL